MLLAAEQMNPMDAIEPAALQLTQEILGKETGSHPSRMLASLMVHSVAQSPPGVPLLLNVNNLLRQHLPPSMYQVAYDLIKTTALVYFMYTPDHSTGNRDTT